MASFNPKTVIVRSNTNPNQYFYMFFMNVPNSEYPLSQIVPGWDGNKVVSFLNMNYSFPEEGENPESTCQALVPFSVIYPDGDNPTIEDVEYTAANGTKKGRVKGVQVYEDIDLPGVQPMNPTTPPSMDYVCKGRTFVIKPVESVNAYFVGVLVDFPINEMPSAPVSYQAILNMPVSSTTNPDQTYVMLIYQPSTYDGNATPKTADFKTIHVFQYADPEYRGIFLNETEDLYANPWLTDQLITSE